MATGTALGFHGHVLIDEGTLLVGVTFHANGIAAGHRPNLTESRSTVDVVTVAALDQAFIDAMMIWFGKVGFRGGVTSITEARLCAHEKVLGFFGIVRRVTVEAANIVAGVLRCGKMPLFVLLPMTAQATRIGFLFRNCFEVHDLCYVATAVDVRRSRTVA